MKFQSNSLPGAIPALRLNAADLKKGHLRMGIARHADHGETWVEIFPVDSDWDTLAKRELKEGQVWALNVNYVISPDRLAETARLVALWNSGQPVWDPEVLTAVADALQTNASELLDVCRQRQDEQLTEEQIVMLLTVNQSWLAGASEEVNALSPEGLKKLVSGLAYRWLCHLANPNCGPVDYLLPQVREAFKAEQAARESMQAPDGFDLLIPSELFSRRDGRVADGAPERLPTTPEGWRLWHPEEGAFKASLDGRLCVVMALRPPSAIPASYASPYLAIKWT